MKKLQANLTSAEREAIMNAAQNLYIAATSLRRRGCINASWEIAKRGQVLIRTVCTRGQIGWHKFDALMTDPTENPLDAECPLCGGQPRRGGHRGRCVNDTAAQPR